METETPMMLLFVSNGTDTASIQSDIRQMLETALDKVDMNGMMPEEFDHMEVPEFTLRLNALRLPSQAKQNHKTYDHFKDQGKKAYHCEVAKELVPFFKFLGNYAHRLRLEVKYFGKFAKFTETLGNNAPISDCTKLRPCMQGHVNYHLSSTSLVLVINGIDNLDATEVLRNTISNAALTRKLERIPKEETESQTFRRLSPWEAVEAELKKAKALESVKVGLVYDLFCKTLKEDPEIQWDRIIDDMHAKDPWEDLRGAKHDGLPGKSVASLWECICCCFGDWKQMRHYSFGDVLKNSFKIWEKMVKSIKKV